MAFWRDDWEAVPLDNLTARQLLEVIELILEDLKVTEILKHRYDNRKLVLHKFEVED